MSGIPSPFFHSVIHILSLILSFHSHSPFNQSCCCCSFSYFFHNHHLSLPSSSLLLQECESEEGREKDQGHACRDARRKTLILNRKERETEQERERDVSASLSSPPPPLPPVIVMQRHISSHSSSVCSACAVSLSTYASQHMYLLMLCLTHKVHLMTFERERKAG